LALRQAARHVTQFYDQVLAPSGLRTTQLSVLVKLQQLGPMTINNLAKTLVMNRTTLGRNVLPLQRDGLIAAVRGADRRSKELHVTKTGQARLRIATKLWVIAQGRFEAAFGAPRTSALRAVLREISVKEFSGS
jgi:DNA-binding MarR family transcriptional regulator